MTHIDDWLDDPKNKQEHPSAHAFFTAFRRPALEQARHPYDGTLFCRYKGKSWRVTGCSRMGDVWLHSRLDWEEGKIRGYYERRVNVDECSEWSDKPAL